MIDAMKQALEALDYAMAIIQRQLTTKTKQEYSIDKLIGGITALRQAIAEAEKQPSLCVCVESIKPHPFKGWEIT
jgi:hypothetical protein